MSRPGDWPEQLRALAWRVAGAGPDLAALALACAWCVFVFLCRVAGGIAYAG